MKGKYAEGFTEEELQAIAELVIQDEMSSFICEFKGCFYELDRNGNIEKRIDDLQQVVSWGFGGEGIQKIAESYETINKPDWHMTFLSSDDQAGQFINIIRHNGKGGFDLDVIEIGGTCELIVKYPERKWEAV